MDALTALCSWGGSPAGGPWRTATSELVLGVLAGRPVVVKVALDEEERRGGRLMAWWDGRGAARVLELDGDAILLERLVGTRGLATMSRAGQDDEATAVLAAAAVRLHGHGVPPAGVGLVPLRRWFTALLDRTAADPLLRRCAAVAERALAATTAADVVALHGDVHHGNVLDAGDEWRAIDPKGLLGHRAFDFANLLVNPDEHAASLLHRRLPVVAAVAGLDGAVLRDWAVAWCGLSLSWTTDEEPSWHARSCRAVAEALLA